MRQILRRANANVAAGHYYFRSKEVLYRRCIASSLGPIQAERMENIARLEAESAQRVVLVDELLWGYIWPHVRRFEDIENVPYLQMISRFPVEPKDLVKPLFDDHISPIRDRYITFLANLAPQLNDDVLQRYFGWIIMLMTIGPFDVSYEMMAGRHALPADREMFARNIIVVGAAAFTALAGDGMPSEGVGEPGR